MSQQLTCLVIPYDIAPNRDFEVTVCNSIDQILSALGKQVKDSFYNKLETSYGVKRQEIGSKTVMFTKALENLFGVSAKLLEINIMHNLNRQVKDFSYRPKSGDFSFADYLVALQKHMEQN